MAGTFWNGVCLDCFYEVQRKKGCVCPLTKARKEKKFYYCSFCDEFHYPGDPIICKECARKQDAYFQRKEAIKKAIFIVGLPSMAVGIIIGFFLC